MSSIRFDKNSRNAIFTRKFRYTVKSNLCSGVGHMARSFKVNLVKNKINFTAYEMLQSSEKNYNIYICDWIDQLKKGTKDTLIFTNYDATGREIQQIKFKGVTLKSAKYDYDYSSTGEVIYKIKLKFSEYERNIKFTGFAK